MPAIIPSSLNPSLAVRYLNETITKEGRGHMHHSLNTPGAPHRTASMPPARSQGGNPQDYYDHTWKCLTTRYSQAAGAPSALVEMARRHTGQDQYHHCSTAPRPATGLVADSRPATGASGRSGRSRPMTGASAASRHSSQANVYRNMAG
mmetsp:Transcript_69943/g.183445  ORF Transcript_69943/g.183445 Transcript_69943/m.183445 type:complete len:149 (+) Transcript_69943:105-551(+)